MSNFSLFPHFFHRISIAVRKKKKKTPGFVLERVNPLPDDKILDWSKLKHSADDNFEFDINSRNFSKLVENTGGKGEIAHYKQFLLFPTVFLKGLFPSGVKRCHCVGMG